MQRDDGGRHGNRTQVSSCIKKVGVLFVSR